MAARGGRLQRAWRVGAVVAVAAGAACSGAFEGPPQREATEEDPVVEAAPTTTTTVVPVRDVDLHPVDDHGTVDDDGRMGVGHDAAEVEVGFLFALNGPHPGPAVLRFGPIALPATCIARATLRVTVTGQVRTPIAVYPGGPATVTSEAGQALPSWGTLLDNRPRGTLEVEGGSAVADVTELVRTWVSGGPFPSRGFGVDPTQPVVLVVQPEAAVSGETFRLHLTESGPSTAPTLTLATNC